jgi:hypothetical protein
VTRFAADCHFCGVFQQLPTNFILIMQGWDTASHHS